MLRPLGTLLSAGGTIGRACHTLAAGVGHGSASPDNGDDNEDIDEHEDDEYDGDIHEDGEDNNDLHNYEVTITTMTTTKYRRQGRGQGRQ